MKPQAFIYAEYERVVEEKKRLKAENENLRNELCFKCGQYKYGSCGWCKWRAENGTD